MKFVLDEKELEFDNSFTVLYFYAHWLPLHKSMISKLNRLEEEFPSVTFVAIDIEKLKTTPKRFSISSIPTILFFKKNKSIKRIVGLTMITAIRSALIDICQIAELENKND